MKKIFYPVLSSLLLITSAFVTYEPSQQWKIKKDFQLNLQLKIHQVFLKILKVQ